MKHTEFFSQKSVRTYVEEQVWAGLSEFKDPICEVINIPKFLLVGSSVPSTSHLCAVCPVKGDAKFFQCYDEIIWNPQFKYECRTRCPYPGQDPQLNISLGEFGKLSKSEARIEISKIVEVLNSSLSKHTDAARRLLPEVKMSITKRKEHFKKETERYKKNIATFNFKHGVDY